MSQLFSLVFNVNFLTSVVRVSTPLILVAMAACVGKQANVQTVAYEGMMLFAALIGSVCTYYTKTLIGGVLLGIAVSVFVALFYGYFNIFLKTDDTLLGLAINIFAQYGTIFLMFLMTGKKTDSSALASLKFPNIELTFLKDIPVIGTVFASQSLITYIAILSVFVTHFILYKTSLGLRIRSVGRNPDAAISLGINVEKTQMISLVISGVLAGLGGEFMSMSYLSFFTKNMVSGRGFIGIAASNLGLGKPILSLLYALMFAVSQVLANQLQYLQFQYQFADMLPYIVTIIGLCITGSAEIRKEKHGGKAKRSKKIATTENK